MHLKENISKYKELHQQTTKVITTGCKQFNSFHFLSQSILESGRSTLKSALLA